MSSQQRTVRLHAPCCRAAPDARSCHAPRSTFMTGAPVACPPRATALHTSSRVHPARTQHAPSTHPAYHLWTWAEAHLDRTYSTLLC